MTPDVLSRTAAMRCVLVESPFRGQPRGVEYARAAMLDCLNRGEAPFASHLLYTQVLDDNDADERVQGIEAGLAIGTRMDATVVYVDLGISLGMHLGIAQAEACGRPIEQRTLPGWAGRSLEVTG